MEKGGGDMPTPSKPYAVITSEKKSHRTKAELEQRKKAEESLVTGVRLKEAPEVRADEYAHKQFRRIKKLLDEIGKSDDLYGASINRYCLITSEIRQLEEERAYYTDMIREMREDLHEQKDKLDDPVQYIEILADVGRSMAKISASISGIDRRIQQKRKMLLDIEKESVMTIAASLRSIPKTEEKASNPLLEALRSG
jgi:phage terminase small subunit